MKVIVTGACGFIGKRLLPMLVSKGFDVAAITNQSVQNKLLNEVEWFQGDLFDPLIMKQLFEDLGLMC